MRAFLELLHGSLGNQGVDKVGTVHDMRFVFLDNDTKLLFCTAYDGDWDPYIDDAGLAEGRRHADSLTQSLIAQETQDIVGSQSKERSVT